MEVGECQETCYSSVCVWESKNSPADLEVFFSSFARLSVGVDEVLGKARKLTSL